MCRAGFHYAGAPNGNWREELPIKVRTDGRTESWLGTRSYVLTVDPALHIENNHDQIFDGLMRSVSSCSHAMDPCHGSNWHAMAIVGSRIWTFFALVPGGAMSLCMSDCFQLSCDLPPLLFQTILCISILALSLSTGTTSLY